jgi:hypothetical protein
MRDTKLKSFIAAHLAPLGLGASAASTGILPAGPDTYTVTERRSPVLGGSVEAQKVATLEANDHCAKQGRVFQPMNFQTLSAMSGTGTETGYTVTFRCLPPGDRDLQRPVYERQPTTVIETRTR